MSLQETVNKTWNKNILFSALVELTYRCNLDCVFCYNDLELKGTPLTKEQYFRFFEDLREMQVLNLILSGGEPLAHPDFVALGERARQLGFVIRIKSNGHALRGALAQRIKEVIDPFIVELSLHGASPETHDRQTRVSGSFERLIHNVREMKGLGIRLKLKAVLTCWNEEEMEQMFELADELETPIRFDPEVTPRDDGDASTLSLAVSDKGLKRLYRLEVARAADVGLSPDEEIPTPARKHCGAGSSAIAVDPFGNIYPCVQWRRPVGNLHEQSIRDVWSNSFELSVIRKTSEDAKELIDQKSAQRQVVSFCPGVAELVTGNPLSLYRSAERRSDIVAELRSNAKKKVAGSQP
jgi:radical SAM protein with 4Fe4S-binding SPASM domain